MLHPVNHFCQCLFFPYKSKSFSYTENFFIFFKCIQYKLFSSPIRYQIIESGPRFFRRVIRQLKPPGDTILGLHAEPLSAGI